MLEEIVCGMLYRASHEYQEAVAQKLGGGWCNGYGFKLPVQNDLFWDAENTIRLYEEEKLGYSF